MENQLLKLTDKVTLPGGGDAPTPEPKIMTEISEESGENYAPADANCTMADEAEGSEIAPHAGNMVPGSVK